MKKETTRKPGPGMFLEAQKDLNIDMVNSIMVGDKLTDVQASVAAGVGYHYLLMSSREEIMTGDLAQNVSFVSDLSVIAERIVC